VNAALQIAAGVLPQHGGWMVKTLGDEAMCAFEDPNQAVEAACAIHQRIEEKTQLDGCRIAMHMGLVWSVRLKVTMFSGIRSCSEPPVRSGLRGPDLNRGSDLQCAHQRDQERARPLFFAVLKGNTAESTVYRVLWHTDISVLTCNLPPQPHTAG
jgi:hypothetical protein